MKPQPLAKGLFAPPKPEVRSVAAPRPGFEVMLQVAAKAQSLAGGPMLLPTTEPAPARQAETPTVNTAARLKSMSAPTNLLHWPPPSANTSMPLVRATTPAQRANETDAILLTPPRLRTSGAPTSTPPDVTQLRTVVAGRRFTPLADQRPPITWSTPASASVPAAGGLAVLTPSPSPSHPAVSTKVEPPSRPALTSGAPTKVEPPSSEAARPALTSAPRSGFSVRPPTNAAAPIAPKPATGGAITSALTMAPASPQLPSAPRAAAVPQVASAPQPAVAPLTPRTDPSPIPQRPTRVAERRSVSEAPSPPPQVTVSAIGAPSPILPALPPQPQPDVSPARVVAAPRTVPSFVASSLARPAARQPTDDRDDRPLLRRAAAPEPTMFAQRAPDAVGATVAAVKPFDTKPALIKADAPKHVAAPTLQLSAPFMPKSAPTPRVTTPQQLDAVATRAKAQHEVQRVSTTSATSLHHPKHGKVNEPEPVAPERRKVRDELKPEPLAPPIAATPQPTPLPEPSPLAAPPPPPVVPAVLEPMLTQVAEDPSLRISLMPMVARVSLETPDAGRVSLQLKVADGVTDVRATGPAAASLELRQNELRVALAHEGLALGNFDLTQSNQQHQRPERPEADLPRSPRPTTSSPDRPDDDGRLHVKA